MSDASHADETIVGSLCVLVVEDHPKVALYVQRMIRQALHPREVILLAASSAQDAIRVLAGSSVDVVVSDYNLGDSTGDEVLDYLRTVSPRTTFVFHSGSAEPHKIHDKVIDKGLPPAQLREEIQRHLLRSVSREESRGRRDDPSEHTEASEPQPPPHLGENSTTALIPTSSS